MTIVLQQSRVLKALTDQGLAESFETALRRLEATRTAIIASRQAARDPAGQAAMLTAAATAKRVFGNVTLVTGSDLAIRSPLHGSSTLSGAARELGIAVTATMPVDCTHCISIGATVDSSWRGFTVRCWWDGWTSGLIHEDDDRRLGESWLPLAGSFAGALAVREVFGNVRGERPTAARPAVVSLWEPWSENPALVTGPSTVFLPRDIWVIGLGHLGQGFLWNLGMLPAYGGRVILQDHQDVGLENVATQILSRAGDVGSRKARVVSREMESHGWRTELVERKYLPSTPRSQTDPGLVVCGLDSVSPRLDVQEGQFPYMLDMGVGHGPSDFEALQLRVIPSGQPPAWPRREDVPSSEHLLQISAYRALSKTDRCGAVTLAQTSVAVPFVGAAMGSLAVSAALRLGAMQATVGLLQVQLSSPEMTSSSNTLPRPAGGLGAIEVDLVSGETKL